MIVSHLHLNILLNRREKFISHMPVKRHLMICPVIKIIYIIFNRKRGICKQKRFLKLVIEQ